MCVYVCVCVCVCVCVYVCQQVTEALIARGVEEDEAYLCVKISGFDGYLNFGVDPEGPEAPGLLQQTTDNVCVTHTSTQLQECTHTWTHTRMAFTYGRAHKCSVAAVQLSVHCTDAVCVCVSVCLCVCVCVCVCVCGPGA